MLSHVWSSALADPLLAFLLLLALSFALAAIVTVAEARREARRTRVTTDPSVGRDAFTQERRRRLQLRQGGRGKERAS